MSFNIGELCLVTIYIPLTTVGTNSFFSKMDNSGSCGCRPQQIMGGLRSPEIFGWPEGPPRYLLLALRASKRLKTTYDSFAILNFIKTQILPSRSIYTLSVARGKLRWNEKCSLRSLLPKKFYRFALRIIFYYLKD